MILLGLCYVLQLEYFVAVLQGGRAGNGTGSELRTVEVCSAMPAGPSNEFGGPFPVEWLCTSDMTVPRTCLAAASLGDSLYAVGGQAGRQIWDTVEVYHSHRDSWVQLPGHMHSERKYTSAGVLHGKSLLASGCLPNHPPGKFTTANPVDRQVNEVMVFLPSPGLPLFPCRGSRCDCSPA